MRFLSVCLCAVLSAAACGGDSDAGPDASNIDAGPSLRLDAVIDTIALCPEGWTTGPIATDVEGANRIEISASCADGAEEVILQYAPRPTGAGDTAPCTQSTFRSATGSTVICRVNNMVRLDPEGQLSTDSETGTIIDGECGCMGDAGGTAGADFLLALD